MGNTSELEIASDKKKLKSTLNQSTPQCHLKNDVTAFLQRYVCFEAIVTFLDGRLRGGVWWGSLYI